MNEEKEIQTARKLVDDQSANHETGDASIVTLPKKRVINNQINDFFKYIINNKPILVLFIVTIIFIFLITSLFVARLIEPEKNETSYISENTKEYIKSVNDKTLGQNPTDEEKSIYYNSKIGLFINNNDISGAYNYYKKEKLLEQSIQINTQYLVLMADYLKKSRNNDDAKILYQKAIDSVDIELKSSEYTELDKQDMLTQKQYLVQAKDKI